MLARSGSAQTETLVCSACLEAPALCQSPQRHQALFMRTGSRRARASSHSPAYDMKLRQHHTHCEAESCDILLHLAGVNEYRGLGAVGDARWKACGSSLQVDPPRVCEQSTRDRIQQQHQGDVVVLSVHMAVTDLTERDALLLTDEFNFRPIKTLIANAFGLFPGLESWPQRLRVWSQPNAMINRVVFVRACIGIIGTRNQLERLAVLGVFLR